MHTSTYPDYLAPLVPWLSDPEVLEILVNGHDNVYLERSGRLVKVDSPFRSEEQLLEVMDTIAGRLGRRLDEMSPYTDARLPDDARVNMVIPPIALSGPSLVIRKLRTKGLTTEELIRFGSWDEDIVRFLRTAVTARLNIVVAGFTGSGKTTFLNALASMIPDDQRVVTVENAAELRLPQRRVVPMESRPPDMEGRGEITMGDLVRNALHMRPDRIVVGEVRGGEAFDILRAMTTGHDGTMFTVHAGNPRDALARLETMSAMANPSVPLLNLRQQMTAAVDLIVQVERMPDGSRKVVTVTEVRGMRGDVVMLQDIFVYRQTGGTKEGKIQGYHTATGATPKWLSDLRPMGIEPPLPISMFVPK
jgi:pilus assembly protein CpaF